MADSPTQSPAAASQQQLLCVMTVEIGDGRTGVVNIHTNDAPRTLAARFIETHHLTDDVLEALTEHIANNQDVARERILGISSPPRDVPRAPASVETPAFPVSSDLDAASAGDGWETPRGGRSAAPAPATTGSTQASPDLAARSFASATTLSPPASRHDVPSNAAEPVSPAPAAAEEGDNDAAAEYEAMQQQYVAMRAKNVPRKVSTTSSTARRSNASATATARPALAAAPPRAPQTASSQSYLRPTALSAARSGTGPAKRPPMPAGKPADPRTFDRLYAERAARDARQLAAAERAAQTAAAQLEEERRAALRIDERSGSRERDVAGVRGGERLFEEGKVAEARKAARREEMRSAMEEQQRWVCAACGFENHGSRTTCSAVTKIGRSTETAGAAGAVGPTASRTAAQAHVRVCGAPRPAEPFHPVISTFAGRMARPLDHDAHVTLQIEKYLAERRRREQLAVEAEEAAVSACAFVPRINANSTALSHARRQKLVDEHVRHVGGTGEDASTAPPPSTHELLYMDALQRMSAHEGAAGPAPWHGCSFQPDVGTTALRGGGRDEPRDAFFQRLFAEGAAARARLDALRERLHEEETGGIRARRVTLVKQHIGPSLYAQALASMDAARASREEEDLRVARAASKRHTSSGSDKLLLRMRQRSLASIFLLLCRSCDAHAASRMTPAVEGAGAQPPLSVDMRDVFDDEIHPRGVASGALSPDELAKLIASVDAHADVNTTELPDPALADPAHYEAVYADAIVERASKEWLDVTACRPDLLDAALAPFAKAVLHRIHTSTEPPQQMCAFNEFVAVMGQLLEDVGGGPHVYLLARRAARSRSRSMDASGIKRPASVPAAADVEKEDAGSLLDRQSAAIVKRLIAQGRLQAASSGFITPAVSSPQDASAPQSDLPSVGVPEREPVHARLHRKSEEYASNRRALQVQADRHELQLHPFKPQPHGSARSSVPEGPAQASLMNQIEALRARNESLADRARYILQHSELLNRGTNAPLPSAAAAPTAIVAVAAATPPQAAEASTDARRDEYGYTPAVAPRMRSADGTVGEAGEPHAAIERNAATSLSALAEEDDTQGAARENDDGVSPLHATLSKAAHAASASSVSLAVEDVDGLPDMLERLSEMSLASLEARINRILSVDPAVAAKASSTARRLGSSATSQASSFDTSSLA